VRVLVASLISLVAAAATACGQPAGDGAATTRTGTPDPPAAAGEREQAVDRANTELRRAARQEDRAAVLRAQRELDELAGEDPDPQAAGPGEEDGFSRAIAGLRFKQGPLYVQQLLTTTGESRAFAAVLRDYFCLLTEQARTEAAAAVYGPLQRRMRDEGVADFELIVIPVTQTAPRAEAVLAVGREGRLRLTARGRAC